MCASTVYPTIFIPPVFIEKTLVLNLKSAKIEIYRRAIQSQNV
jgi:hypothetical protein